MTAAVASRAAACGSGRAITAVVSIAHAVHEEGFQIDRGPDGELRFHRPDGRLLPEVPPPSEVRGDPVEILRARHDAAGLVLHAHTATPGWLGERLDICYAVDVLHPLAQ